MDIDKVVALEYALGDDELTQMYIDGDITAEEALEASLKLSVMTTEEINALGNMYTCEELYYILIDEDSTEADLLEVSIISPVSDEGIEESDPTTEELSELDQ